MENTYRILIAEDEPKLGLVIQEELARQGYQADMAYDGAIAEKLFNQHHYSLILLDINLPYKNGLALCKEFRQQNNKVPIIMLTALGEIQDKVDAFSLGADDYIVKPFNMKELLSRINVFLRRNKMIITNPKKIYTIGSFSFIPQELKLTKGQEKINLTQRETDLLEFLCLHSDKV